MKDNDKLEELLISYKEASVRLLKLMESEKYDEIDLVLNERQNCIEKINLIKYSKKEFKTIADKLNLLEFEDRINKLVHQKRKTLIIELNNISKQKNMNNSYNKGFYNNSTVFSKRV